MMDKHLSAIVDEMFTRVGASRKNVNVKRYGWFLQHAWTRQQEDDFVGWLTDYFMKNEGARKELMGHTVLNSRKRCREAAEEFVWNYGWKVILPQKTSAED